MQRYEPRLLQAFLNRSVTNGCWLLLTGLLSVRTPAGAQDIGPASFRDSLVMRQVAYRAPCPSPAPRSWTLVDSTLGMGLRCSLVEWAVRALEVQLDQRPSLKTRADPRNPLCVRVVVAKNTGTTGLPGDWIVVFDLAADVPAHVMIDRQSGGIMIAVVGRAEWSADLPACVVRGG